MLQDPRVKGPKLTSSLYDIHNIITSEADIVLIMKHALIIQNVVVVVYVALTFITNHLWKHQHHHDLINSPGLHKLAEYLTLDVVTEFAH